MSNQQNTNSTDSKINKSAVNTTLSNTWAVTVSDYLSTRQQQTHVAYQKQLTDVQKHDDSLNSNANIDITDTVNQIMVDDETQQALFKALFMLLVQRLEEGHTVLTLTDGDILSSSINSNSSHTTDDFSHFTHWQQQLLLPLYEPLLAYSGNVVDVNSATDLLLESLLWQRVKLQANQSPNELKLWQSRYEICKSLYHLFERMNHLDNKQNSLSSFKNILKNNKQLKENKKLDNSSQDKAIVYQINEKSSDKQFNNNSSTSNEVDLTLTFWLQRAWQAEYTFANNIQRIRNQSIEPLPMTLNSQLNANQKNAIAMANQSAFSIITGGPGTGKTYTVAQLVIALQQVNSNETNLGLSSQSNLALAAPTGKAAQRMQESLQAAIVSAGLTIQLPEAKTIHRLLAIGRGGQPKYNRDNPLSEDIVIVDEASMLGVELANHLVSAIKPNARLILLGDANQLAAVDAGAVLADLCQIESLQEVHEELQESKRFTSESGIGKLAKFINQDDKNSDEVWTLIDAEKSLTFYNLQLANIEGNDSVNRDTKEMNSLSNFKFYKKLERTYRKYFGLTKLTTNQNSKAKSTPRVKELESFNNLMNMLNQFKVLTAGHHGRAGDHAINEYLSEQHKKLLKLPLSKSPWYHGRPIMILQNSYELGLFNGDIGICMQSGEGRLEVFFENQDQGIAINMLSNDRVATAYAMTIHKSQGSEFTHVAICFDDNNARLLSKELIYTAVTRAKERVSLFSTETAFVKAISTPTIRQTGIALQFQSLS